VGVLGKHGIGEGRSGCKGAGMKFDKFSVRDVAYVSILMMHVFGQVIGSE
jgi:hypothetical protein